MEKIRSTDEGREKNRAAFEKILITPEGQEKNRATLEKLRSTDEGREKKEKILKTFFLPLKDERDIGMTWKKHVRNRSLLKKNVLWIYHFLQILQIK